MTSSPVVSRVDGPVLEVTLDRPAARNALNRSLLAALSAAVASFAANDALRVLVLSGSDCGAFCVGGDMKEFSMAPLQASGDETRVFQLLEDCPKPTVAAIDGFCLGGGFELALSCDIRLATTASSFGLPEPRAGMLSERGLDDLSRWLPLGEALHLQLTGSRMSAERAYQLGLVQTLAPDRAALAAATAQLSAHILACAPSAVNTIKQLVRVGSNLPIEYARRMSAPYRAAANGSPEAIEGMTAFAEKRPPHWTTGQSEGERK